MNYYAKRLIKCWEGCKLQAYQCSAGVWTIGYGRTKDIKQGDKISQRQADIFLGQDLSIYTSAVLREVDKLGLKSWQVGALISFTYNLGGRNFRRSELLATIKEDPENYDDIARGFLNWDNAGGREIKGLSKRRISEANCYANGRI